jgi:hypothetical protein
MIYAPDKERPEHRGKRDAPKMGERSKSVKPDLILNEPSYTRTASRNSSRNSITSPDISWWRSGYATTAN